jgi:hypothetical protein
VDEDHRKLLIEMTAREARDLATSLLRFADQADPDARLSREMESLKAFTTAARAAGLMPSRRGHEPLVERQSAGGQQP